MKILIVEDDSERISTFMTLFKDHDVMAVNTARAAKDLVEKIKFDVIFLDHDLGNKVFVDSNDANTGMQVAKYIEGTCNMDSRFIVHSWNPEGARNIESYLKSMGCRLVEVKMFGMFDSAILYN